MKKIGYSHKEISFFYERLYLDGDKAKKKNHFFKAISFFSYAAELQYYYNSIYVDYRIEYSLKQISEKLLEPYLKLGITNRYVFYDALGRDKQGLSQQYIDALNNIDCEFMFIFENCSYNDNIEIIRELKRNRRVRVVEMGKNLSLEQKITFLYSLLKEYNPSKAFLHLLPWSTMAIVVFHAFPNITKYQINLTDHAFWLGAFLLDFSIEFRNYGYTVSLERRRITIEKLLVLPFYPIVTKEKYLGLPVGVANKVKILSGGAYYKIYGENDFFFFLMKDILEDNPRVVILFVGTGNDLPLRKFIHNHNLESRIILLGFRKDINELFKYSDIFLGTYPIGGGLMSQYAAIHSKPLLVFAKKNDKSIESIICTNKYADFSIYDRVELLSEAKKLVNNSKYRIDRGRFFYDLIIKKEHFIDEFAYMLVENSTKRAGRLDIIDYNDICEKYYFSINSYEYALESILYRAYKLKLIHINPKVFFNILLSLHEILCNKLKKKKTYSSKNK